MNKQGLSDESFIQALAVIKDVQLNGDSTQTFPFVLHPLKYELHLSSVDPSVASEHFFALQLPFSQIQVSPFSVVFADLHIVSFEYDIHSPI